MPTALCGGGGGCRLEHVCWTWLLCRISTGIAVPTLMCVTLQCAQAGGHPAGPLTLGWLWGSLWPAEAHAEGLDCASLGLSATCHNNGVSHIPGLPWVPQGETGGRSWPQPSARSYLPASLDTNEQGKKPSFSSSTQVLFCFGAHNSIAAEG